VVELIEYLLVFGVTTALAGFSLLVFGGFLPTLHETQGQAELDQIAGAAGLAAQNGSAALVLTMDNASITCSGGVVHLSTGGETYSSSIGASCNFGASDLDGVCKLVFTRSEAGVGMEVG
jgi:hypothetical protein